MASDGHRLLDRLTRRRVDLGCVDDLIVDIEIGSADQTVAIDLELHHSSVMVAVDGLGAWIPCPRSMEIIVAERFTTLVREVLLEAQYHVHRAESIRQEGLWVIAQELWVEDHLVVYRAGVGAKSLDDLPVSPVFEVCPFHDQEDFATILGATIEGLTCILDQSRAIIVGDLGSEFPDIAARTDVRRRTLQTDVGSRHDPKMHLASSAVSQRVARICVSQSEIAQFVAGLDRQIDREITQVVGLGDAV